MEKLRDQLDYETGYAQGYNDCHEGPHCRFTTRRGFYADGYVDGYRAAQREIDEEI